VSGDCWSGATMLPVYDQNPCGTGESADTQHQRPGRRRRQIEPARAESDWLEQQDMSWHKRRVVRETERRGCRASTGSRCCRHTLQ